MNKKRNLINIKLQIFLFLICSFSYGQNVKLDSAYYYFEKAKDFDFKNKHYKAYNNYIKSLNLYKELNLEDSIANCNLKLFELITSQTNLEDNSKPYLDNYYNYAMHKQDTFLLLKSTMRYAQYYWDEYNIDSSRNYYLKSLKFTNNLKLEKYKPSVFSNLAYLYVKTIPDSANFYFNKIFENKHKLNKTQLVGNYINYALFLNDQKKCKQAIATLKKAENIKLDNYQLKYNKIIYRNFIGYYKAIGDYKNAFEYSEKYNIVKDSLNNTAQNIAISNLDKKYQTAEKDKQILISEQKRKQNRNLLIGSMLFIVFGGIIAYLNLKNAKRKRLLAEQQKELEKQKNITLIKEQELTTINAMVDGQEKERKRIAEDLHDNLGSVLATLKLHFENLKINREKKKINQETLFDKTEGLIDEAYLKVRSIAHAKNAGVIAKQGLLIAIKMMAEKISSADKIQIDVIDFGLDKRLENSLEINVFRIIQELITNVIKHADAINATINISLYDKTLNIIIEDDGKGFDNKKVNLKNGMGISSIKTRVEHLKGSFDIDSAIGKGSSIIIDIPIS